MPSALVIEENRTTSESLCQLLGLLDITARPAYTQRAAYLTLKEMLPDFIFLSIHPLEAGFLEVLDFLKRETNLEHIPVILLATAEQKEIVQRMSNTGVLEVIQRPASLEAVEKALRKAGLS